MVDRASNTAEATYVSQRVSAIDFDLDAWGSATPIPIAHYWSGDPAPSSRHAEARVLWDSEGLSMRFNYRQREPFIVSDAPDTNKKAIGLWDSDVCEIFVAPDETKPQEYFEFEAAPTGEWLDLRIRLSPEGRETDWNYSSDMKTATRIVGDEVTIILRVPWVGLGKTPRAGDKWRANFFRCAGSDPDRGYVAWKPTYTPEPSFHEPSHFGTLLFR